MKLCQSKDYILILHLKYAIHLCSSVWFVLIGFVWFGLVLY